MFFEGVSHFSCLAFLLIFFGYICNSSLLVYLFYCGKNGSSSCSHLLNSDAKDFKYHGKFWTWPLFSRKDERGQFHKFFTSINLIIASSFAFMVTEASVRNATKLRFNKLSLKESTIDVIFGFSIAVIYQSVLEYYWHRIMHLSFLYKLLHKYHHFYKSPEPWDDLYIHPLEAIGYYCILYSPPFLFDIHFMSFVLYIILMGICGVLDHSGVDLSFGYLYNTRDHFNHHMRFNVNYAFPFPAMDILHGTYFKQ